MDARKDGRTVNNVALTHPFHEENLVGPPSDLGGDSVTDKWTDAGRMGGQTHGKIMLLSHTLAMR